jgi:membrane-associated HD superfamily phosphohydrolase
MDKLLSRIKITHNLTNDDVREIAMNIVDAFVEENLIKDNTDTNDDTEFAFQDIIHNKLNEIFILTED